MVPDGDVRRISDPTLHGARNPAAARLEAVYGLLGETDPDLNRDIIAHALSEAHGSTEHETACFPYLETPVSAKGSWLGAKHVQLLMAQT